MNSEILDQKLEEIFSVSPLKEPLREYKKRFKAGKLGIASKVKLIEEYTNYKIVITIEQNDNT